jgi:phosphonopyruvate decarboxylase
MGHTTPAAFGLALGLPGEKVVIIDSEGALLMNLGVLASIAGKAPKNFVHFLLDNECYATTGGQPVPNAQRIDYAGLAKSAGYASTHHFDDLEDLVTSMGTIMNEEGPVFVSVKIEAEVQNLPIGLRERSVGRSRDESIRDFQKELGIETV